MTSAFLHEHREFASLLKIVGKKNGIEPLLVEKDYWIMQALWGLNDQGLEFELKGGTSLSKGYKIIERFSEDIDIKIVPPADRKVAFGKNKDKPSHVESRKAYFDWLAGNIKIPGFSKVERDLEFDDKEGKYRSGGIRLFYQSHFESAAFLKPGILLEVGDDDTAPNEKVLVSSWAYDHAVSSGVTVRDNRAVDVKCYWPEYTLVEKLQTISTKYRKQQESGTFPPNFLRHYYDVYKLLESDRVTSFIGTDKYKERKAQRFRSENQDIASNDAFTLPNLDVRRIYEQEYLKNAGLYYRGQVSFQEILDRISQFIPKL